MTVANYCQMPQEGSPSEVLDTITTRIGLAPFFERLEGLFNDSLFKAAATGPKAPQPAMRSAPIPPPADEEGRF